MLHTLSIFQKLIPAALFLVCFFINTASDADVTRDKKSQIIKPVIPHFFQKTENNENFSVFNRNSSKNIKSSPQMNEDCIYTLHLASYKNFINTMKDCVELSELTTKNVFVKKIEIPEKGTWFRLYIGEYHSRDEAFHFGEKLKKNGTVNYFAVEKIPQ